MFSINCRQNIFPCLVNRDEHIATITSQNFNNTNVCKMTSREQAQEFMNKAIRMFSRPLTKIPKNKKKIRNKTHNA